MLLKNTAQQKYKTVAVLLGGWSNERDVSLVSGRACAQALRECGYDVIEIDVTSDVKQLMIDLNYEPNVVFNALHGKGGEDGTIQAILDTLGLRYTHSGRMASTIAMDKQLSKDIVAKAGVNVPKGIVLNQNELQNDAIPLSAPYVIKPNSEGSSVGVYIIQEGDNRLSDIIKNWDLGDALIEQFIKGRELTVSVASTTKDKIEAFAVTEIKPRNTFYDYDAKYAAGGSDHVVPAEVPRDIYNTCLDWAIKSHQALGCDGISRTDFLFDDSQSGIDGLYYLETNTQPGMTPTSLVPEQAAHLGINFNALVEWMVENALCHENVNLHQNQVPVGAVKSV